MENYLDDEIFIRLLTEVGKKLSLMETKDRGSFDDQFSDATTTKTSNFDAPSNGGAVLGIEITNSETAFPWKDGELADLKQPKTSILVTHETKVKSNNIEVLLQQTSSKIKGDGFCDGMGPIEKVEKWRESQHRELHQKKHLQQQQQLQAAVEIKKSSPTAAAGGSSNLPSCYGSCPTR